MDFLLWIPGIFIAALFLAVLQAVGISIGFVPSILLIVLIVLPGRLVISKFDKKRKY